MTKCATVSISIAGGGPISQAQCDVLTHLMDRGGSICPTRSIEEYLGFARGRSVATYIAQIRKALPPSRRGDLRTMYAVGYLWSGPRVDLNLDATRESRADSGIDRLAILDSLQVAKRLRISVAEVRSDERSALDKLRSRPDLMDALRGLLESRGRYHYDPFYEIWLMSAQDAQPRFGIPERERSAD